MTLMIVLAVVLVTSTAYLLHEYATHELAPPDAPDAGTDDDGDASDLKAA